MFGGANIGNTLAKNILANNNITVNYHHWGISPANWTNQTHYDIIATSQDRNGKTFVTAFEGKDNTQWQNIYGVQFHPETASFEWIPWDDDPRLNGKEQIPHS